MSKPVDLKCLNCGTTFNPPEDGELACPYCGSKTLNKQSVKSSVMDRWHMASSRRPESSDGSSQNYPWKYNYKSVYWQYGFIGVMIMVLSTVLSLVWSHRFIRFRLDAGDRPAIINRVEPTANRGKEKVSNQVNEPRMRLLDQPIVTNQVKGPRMRLLDQPVVTSISGKEAVLVSVSDDSKPENRGLFVVAVDSASTTQIWRAGPYGDRSDDDGFHFVMSGNHVLVSDFHAKLHFLDLNSGRELAVSELSDRVRCMVVAEKKVYVFQIDQKRIYVDPVSRAMTVSPLERDKKLRCPKSSVFRWSDGWVNLKNNRWVKGHLGRHLLSDLPGWVNPKNNPRVKEPTVEGFQSCQVLTDGQDTIAKGFKYPGTKIPQVIGFDPKAMRVLWRQIVSIGDPYLLQNSCSCVGDLGGHRYVGCYRMKDHLPRLAAFDAGSGMRLWDVEFPAEKEGLADSSRIVNIFVSERFVYVFSGGLHDEAISVFDAQTGRFIGVIGNTE